MRDAHELAHQVAALAVRRRSGRRRRARCRRSPGRRGTTCRSARRSSSCRGAARSRQGCRCRARCTSSAARSRSSASGGETGSGRNHSQQARIARPATRISSAISTAPSRRRCRPDTHQRVVRTIARARARPARAAARSSDRPARRTGGAQRTGRRAARGGRSTPRSRDPLRGARPPRRDHDDRERPGAALAPSEAAREPDHRRGRARARPCARRTGHPAAAPRCTSCSRSAASGVSAETIEMMPAAVANQARSVGVAGRRTIKVALGL